jgi:uncharacterized protein (DUF58 family)
MFLAAAALLALGAVSPAFVVLAIATAGVGLILAALDLRAAPMLGTRELRRVVEPQFSVGVPKTVEVLVRNPLPRELHVTLRDETPVSFQSEPRRLALLVPPLGEARASYVTRPRHRGSYRFGQIHSRQRGPLGLVERQSSVAADAPANVYPDLREVRRYDVTLRRGLAYDAGQRRARVPGAGSLFERLREYERDDDPRAISWKATARRGRPVSMEYEAERQQRVLMLIDAGRMMASTLGELTKLDHAVNTALMLAYVATGKGDEVGLLGFADTVRAYAVPRRGRRQFLRLTEELRRLEVTTTESDHRAAFEFIRARASRRAFVILFTDLVDEEASRGLVAAVTRLAGSNLVLCCVLADPRLRETAQAVPDSTQALYERIVAQEVREARERALAVLRRHGVHVVDVPAERLTVATIQRYLELKKRSF